MSQNDFRGKLTYWTQPALPTLDIGTIFWQTRGIYEWSESGQRYEYVASDGLPRFTPYIWGGKGTALPEGDVQSSGQQLLDAMYPTMRAEVIATQFTCTEAEWQADPYKRVTHWSLGGTGWMRPPDKNGVQPGNVGAFYGVGSNPAGSKLGTAAIDAMRNLVATVPDVHRSSQAVATGAASLLELGQGNLSTGGGGRFISTLRIDASLGLPAGTTTDPITGEFRPRTWYGIWMIRMYGRITNPGDLDAPALNARMDMIDTRVSTLEGRKRLRASGVIKGLLTPATGEGLSGASVIDQGVGDYEVVLSTPAPNDSYTVALTTRPQEGGLINNTVFMHAKTVNGFRIRATQSVSGYLSGSWDLYKSDQFAIDFSVFY